MRSDRHRVNVRASNNPFFIFLPPSFFISPVISLRYHKLNPIIYRM
jgi:hypothetical protein